YYRGRRAGGYGDRVIGERAAGSPRRELGLPRACGVGEARERSAYQLPSTSIVSCPRLCSVTDAASPHSAQRIVPQANSVEKIMSSYVSPSPSAYHGPSSAMRSSTSPAGASGSAANEQPQLGQYSSTCMA